MLNLSMPAISQRIRPLVIALGLACPLFLTGHVHAERLQQREVSIPDASGMLVSAATRLDRSESGAELTVPLDTSETWQLLIRVLEHLSIKPRQQDAQSHRLFTGWILWTWNPGLETGRSKPPLKALSRTYERHRFEFSVSPDAASTGTVIHIRDSARQREVDITPDSEYTWLQWQDAAIQTDAAWSFMRRLQGDFESALSSRLMPPAVVSPHMTEPVQPSGSTRQATQVTPTVPAYSSEPAVVNVAPAITPSAPLPVPAQPLLKQGSNALDRSQPGNEKSTRGANEQQSVEQTPARAEGHQDTAKQPTRGGVSEQPATTPLALQGGQLVDGGLDTTWQALLVAIDALGIELQGSDRPQYMLTTQWINAMYDKKNQQFTLESNTEKRWAFDLRGKGRQRHRFQLVLIALDGGTRTMVYAYHTGFQVETDQTPDSSQTLLYWKEHKNEPAIAMAFLRRLQIVVRQ